MKPPTPKMPRRNDAIALRERDRPGRSSRRLADWSENENEPPFRELCPSADAFGQRPKAAGETPAVPILTASFRLRRRARRTGFRENGADSLNGAGPGRHGGLADPMV